MVVYIIVSVTHGHRNIRWESLGFHRDSLDDSGHLGFWRCPGGLLRDEGTAFLQSARKHKSSDPTSHPRRLGFSSNNDLARKQSGHSEQLGQQSVWKARQVPATRWGCCCVNTFLLVYPSSGMHDTSSLTGRHDASRHLASYKVVTRFS